MFFKQLVLLDKIIQHWRTISENNFVKVCRTENFLLGKRDTFEKFMQYEIHQVPRKFGRKEVGECLIYN